MSKPNDGGPVNPELAPDGSGWVGDVKRIPGMRVRTLLAGMAMQGLLAYLGPSARNHNCAQYACEQADALLKELEK